MSAVSVPGVESATNAFESTPTMTALAVDGFNARFAQAPAAEIVQRALDGARMPVLSTNFRPLSCALLHLVTRFRPDIPVIWIDSGYNTAATYRFAEQLIGLLDLNMHVFTPRITAARRDSLYGGVPQLEAEAEHRRFTDEVKLEPFREALDTLRPDLWFTGIRREQTGYRRTLDVASVFQRDPQPGIVRIAPFFHATDAQIERYISEHRLPDNDDYVDPTKLISGRECGLQTMTT